MTDSINEIFWRLQTLLDQWTGAFFDAYFKGQSTLIPPLSLETLVGTGIWSGKSGSGLTINADGRYFRTYFALGLVGALLYYLSLLTIILQGFKKVQGNNRIVVVLFVLFIVMGEFKEPLLFDWYYQTMFFIATHLFSKSLQNKYQTPRNRQPAVI